MALNELNLQPGIVTEKTARAAKPQYKDCDKVRFRDGTPELIGGWVSNGIDLPDGPTISSVFYRDAPRATHEWSSIDNQKWIAIGTDRRLYLINRSEFDAAIGDPPVFNITPAESSGQLTNPFSTTSGSNVVTVTHTSHGLEDRQGVTFDGASAVGGITVSGDYFVRVVDADTYEIEHTSNASSTAGPGGGTVDYVYEIPPPIDEDSTVGGYGVNRYGTGGYGQPRQLLSTTPELRLWSLDNWGEDLMASPRGLALYTWDRTLGPNVRATIIANAPSANNRIIVSPEDRHVISIGSHDGVSRDQMLVRWSDTEDYNQWTAAEDNTAGDKRLDFGSRLIAALRTRVDILLWTDRSMFSMRFDEDPTVVFRFTPLGENVQIISPQAAAEVNGVVFFMGRGDFFIYDGLINPLPCSVRNLVFDNLNLARADKIVCSVVREFSEIWWHYPTESSENDRYVIYNYGERTWYVGSMSRSAYRDTGPFFERPIGFSPDGVLYLHENSYTEDGEDLTAYVETHDFEIADGDSFMHVSRIVPDFLRLDGAVSVTLRGKRYPQSASYVEKGPYDVDSSTEKLNMRIRARQVALRVDSSAQNEFWKFGTWRGGIIEHGKR